MFINGMLPFSAFYDIMRIYHKKQGAIIMPLHLKCDTMRLLETSVESMYIGSGYSSFYGQLQSSLFFHEKRDINAPGLVSLPFFIIQLSGSRSFPLTSCAFSALFLSRCSIASWFHTFPHLRLSEATQNPCPLCRLSPYRGTR